MDGAVRAGGTDFPRAGQQVLAQTHRRRGIANQAARILHRALHRLGIGLEQAVRLGFALDSDCLPSRLRALVRSRDRRRERGERIQQRGRERRGRQANTTRRYASVARGVERREHAALDLIPTRHADGQRGRAVVAERVGDLQQVSGVLARFGAGAQSPDRHRRARARCAAVARPTTRPDGTSRSHTPPPRASASGSRGGRRAPARGARPHAAGRPPTCRQRPESRLTDAACRAPPGRCARGCEAAGRDDEHPCGRHTRRGVASRPRPGRPSRCE